MTTYNHFDQRIHQLCQIIAKVNRTYVPKKADDSHTNLYYDSVSERMVGRWIVTPKGKGLLAFNINTQTFEWLDETLAVKAQITAIGKTDDEIEIDLVPILQSYGLDTQEVRIPLHFEIPKYPFYNQPIEPFHILHLEEWKSYRTLANEVFATILGSLQIESEVRIWPHHFDTGIYVEPHQHIGIGMGLAMEDSMVGAPYFYIAGYPLKAGEIDFQNRPTLKNGQWRIKSNWKGGILSLATLLKNGGDRKATVLAFYKTTIDWYLNQPS